MATNSTGISVAGVIKWLLVIATLPLLVKVWQGLVLRQTTDNSGRFGALVTGPAAVHEGLMNLLYLFLCIVGALAVWFYQQNYED